MTWTYFFRRLLVNPSYYHMDPIEDDKEQQTNLNTYLSAIVQTSLNELIRATCIVVNADDQRTLEATVYGRIASHYYLSFKTIHMFTQRVSSTMNIGELIDLISSAHEYAEIPVSDRRKQTNDFISFVFRFDITKMNYIEKWSIDYEFLFVILNSILLI